MANDGDSTLAMLVQRRRETLFQLLTRLDLAIAMAYNEGILTDQINAPPTNFETLVGIRTRSQDATAGRLP